MGGTKTATATIAVNLVGNMAPAITTPAAQSIGDTSQHAIGGLAISDTYSGASVTATVSALYGNLNLTAAGGAAITNNNSGTVTITGSLANVNSTLASLKYTTTATATTADTITVSVNDNGTGANLIGGSKTGSATIAVALTGNDVPVVTVPALQTITDINAHPIGGVIVSDSMSGGTLTATVSALNGNLTFTGAGISNNGTGTVTITAASTTALNTILGTLSYTTTATATGADTITVSVNDGNTGAIGGAKTSSNSFAVNLIGNDAPVITVPATQGSIADLNPHALSGISVADIYSGGTVTATLTAQGGTLTDADAGVSGSGTGTLTITGSLSAVNAALADVSYNAAGDGNGGAAADVVSVTVNDGNTTGIGNARSATSTIAVTLINNDTPSITVPSLLTISDSSVHLVSGISATDSLSGTILSATVSDVSGTLSITPAANYTVTTNSSSNLTVTATSLANLNEALATIRYTATATTTSADTITVSLNDTGSSANLISGDLTGTKTIDVNVIGNDAPVLTLAGMQTITTSAANSVAGLSVADTYSGSTVTATVSAQHGLLDFTGAGVTGNDSGNVTISAASVSTLNTILGTMKYTTALIASGTDAISVTVNDNGTGLVGGAKTATGSIEIAVIGNDTPVVSVSGEQSLSDTSQHALSGVGVTDSASAASVTATLSALHGHLTVTGAGAASVGNDGTGTVTVTGSLADVNSTLGTLQYATTATATGSDTVTVTVSDNATTLVGGAKTGSNTINVTLIGNDTPALSVAGGQLFTDVNPHSLSGVGVSDSMSGATVTATVSDNSGHLDIAAGSATVTNNGTNSVTITGSLSAVNTALGTLAYTATAAGRDNITVTVNDGNAIGIGGAKSITGTIEVSVIGNDTPVIHVPTGQTIAIGAQQELNGTSVVDTYSATSVTATVSSLSGTLDFTTVAATIVNNDTTSVTITGGLSDVNAALATLKYTATAYGSDTVTVSLNDNNTSGVGGAKSGSANFIITTPAPPPSPPPSPPPPTPTPTPTPSVPPSVVETPSNIPYFTIVHDTTPAPQTGGNDFSALSTTSSSTTTSPSSTPSTPAPVAPTTVAPSQVNSAPIVTAAPSPAVANDASGRGFSAPATLTAATTSDSGFRIAVVAPASAGGGDTLVSVRPMADVSIGQGGQISYSVGIDTFAHPNAQAVIQLSATQADGKPLPAWLSFDSKSGTLTGTPPAGMSGEVQIRVIARDDQGREAIAVVRIGGEGQRTQPAQSGQQQAPEGQGQRAQPGQPNAPNAQGRPAVPPGTTPNGAPERAPAERHGDASDGHSVISLASFRDGHRTGHEHSKPGLTAQLKAAHRGAQLAQQAALYRAAAQMMNSRA